MFSNILSLNVFLLLYLTRGARSLKEGQTLRVATLYHEPFVMPPEGEGAVGLRGLLIDLMSAIAARTKVKINYNVLKDGKYGNLSPNGSWTGIIGQLVNNQADVGLAALTVTPSRMKVVRFGFPFITTGIVGLGRRATFPFGDEDMNGLLEKSRQGQVLLGALQGGSTENFFRDSSISIYASVDREIQKHPEGFVYNYDQAIDKVRTSVDKDYIFFGEQFILDHAASQEPCDLRILTREPLNTINYAIAFAQNVSDRLFEEFNSALLDMQMFGTVQMLKQKWCQVQCKPFDYSQLCTTTVNSVVNDQPYGDASKNDTDDIAALQQKFASFVNSSSSLGFINHTQERSYAYFNLSGHHFKLYANLSEE